MLQETQSTQDDDELLLNLVIGEIQSDPDPGRLTLTNLFSLWLLGVFRIEWCPQFDELSEITDRSREHDGRVNQRENRISLLLLLSFHVGLVGPLDGQCLWTEISPRWFSHCSTPKSDSRFRHFLCRTSHVSHEEFPQQERSSPTCLSPVEIQTSISSIEWVTSALARSSTSVLSSF